MREWLVDETDKIKDKVSVLALFIMSHGSCGKLQGENGSVGQISDIIDETRKGIPLHIPMVSIITWFYSKFCCYVFYKTFTIRCKNKA